MLAAAQAMRDEVTFKKPLSVLMGVGLNISLHLKARREAGLMWAAQAALAEDGFGGVCRTSMI